AVVRAPGQVIGTVDPADGSGEPHVLVQQLAPVAAPGNIPHPVPHPPDARVGVLAAAHIARQHRLQDTNRLTREVTGEEVQAQLHPAELRHRHDLLREARSPQIHRQPTQPRRGVPHRARSLALAATIETSRLSPTTSTPFTRPSSSAIRSAAYPGWARPASGRPPH